MASALFRDGNGRTVAYKDPDAVLDFSFDWSAWLTDITDTISAVTYYTTGGITVSSQSLASGIATAFISGGTVGTEATLTCRITTAGGRTDDRTLFLIIRNR